MSRDSKITSLSMQLNPENLGKVTVEVATKDGVLSAKVIAETQAAKEALEANLANLKSNLEQQGLKISDVEVTVESHAFEQNLQQEGSREQEQLAKEMQKETAKNLRSINLREVGLGELRGLMSEEDLVVAKMMADNGNTLNIKA
jgi:flagellar hook-length control protein FliK